MHWHNPSVLVDPNYPSANRDKPSASEDRVPSRCSVWSLPVKLRCSRWETVSKKASLDSNGVRLGPEGFEHHSPRRGIAGSDQLGHVEKTAVVVEQDLSCPLVPRSMRVPCAG